MTYADVLQEAAENEAKNIALVKEALVIGLVADPGSVTTVLMTGFTMLFTGLNTLTSEVRALRQTVAIANELV